MTESLETFASRLQGRFEDLISICKVAHGQVTIELPSANLINVCQALRDEPAFSFEQLSDLCGVDYSAYGQAEWETQDTTSTGFSRGVYKGVFHKPEAGEKLYIAVVYHLLSIKHNRRLRLRCRQPTGMNARPLTCSEFYLKGTRICVAC
jgi:NADH-quinone oxidoreductase subunit C